MQLCWVLIVLHVSSTQAVQHVTKQTRYNNQAGEATQSEQEPTLRHPYELKRLRLLLCRPVHCLAEVQGMSLP